MDPLSIAASITALLQLTATVIQYLNTVKGAPTDRQRILMELCSVNGTLYILEEQASQAQQGDGWSSTLLSLNNPNGPIEHFKRALGLLENKLAPAEGWRKVGKAITWPFQKEEIKEILNVIERQKTCFNLARQNDHIGLSKAIKGDVVSLRGEVDEIGKKITQLHLDDNNERIRQWLFAPDPSSNFNKALKERHLRTGTWFIESRVFADWKSTPASFFWLYGIPGCGKTILSSTIIEDVINQYHLNSTVAVLYFYFDFNDVEKQGQEKMIRSLIVQLSTHYGKTPQCLEALYSSCMNGGRQPTRDMLLATLHQMMESFKETFIILDALDECSERQELLEDIEDFNRWTNVNLHILSTSRREKDIAEWVEPLAHNGGKMSINSVRVNDDIRAYVHERLRADPGLKRWRKELKVQQEIENTLLDKADGMFRWAACQLDSLRSCLNVQGLRKRLSSLPKDLDETYARILSNIDEDYRRDALKVLQWLTYSARPLRLEEVAEVVTIDIGGSPRFDPEKRYPEPRDVWTICSSLISIEEEISKDDLEDDDDGNAKIIVRLAHFSVKEYLINGRDQYYSIQEFDEPDSLTTRSVLESLLAEYAAQYWTRHARVAEGGSTLALVLSIELLLTKGHGLLNWIRLYDSDLPGVGSDMTRGLNAPPLYYASCTGLIRSVKSILDKGADVNAQGGRYGNALLVASYQGYDQVVQILLDKGAHINAQHGYYGTALQAALSEGHEQVVQMLLAKGADINAQGGHYGNALQVAISEGYKQVVQMLLAKGADINAQGGYYGNALQAAISEGHEQVIQIPLANRADVNAEGDHSTVLQEASSDSYDIVVQILLAEGADVNAQGGYYGNALQSASLGGYKQLVQILLAKGADVNAQGGHYSTALQAASSEGHKEVVQILLAKGADVNVQSTRGTALQEVSSRGHILVVQILLAHGADVNAQGGYGTALQKASSGGFEQVVEILLAHGADVNAHGEYGTALHAASLKGHEQVVQILLAKGADVNAQGGYFGNALQAASSRGHEQVVQILLDYGADVTESQSDSD